jgi:hypothetical protein
MKLAGIFRMSALSILLVSTALIYAQEQREEAKPAQPEARPEAAKPETARPDAKPQQDENMRPEAKPEAKPSKQEQEEDKAARKNEEKAAKQNDKAAKSENDKSSKQAQRADQSNQRAMNTGDRHSRIPDDKFRANFGRQHTFVVHNTIVEGQPRFQYGGFWFNLVDAWPGDWAYTDECYVDYIDGEYFLIDLAHPGARIAIVVVG